MNHAIVTGSNGFVGRALVNILLEHGVKVTGIDVQDSIARYNGSEIFTFRKADTSDLTPTMLQGIGADTFYHLAWGGSAGPGRADYRLQLRNAETTIDMIKLAHEIGCSKIIVAGSIMEYETFQATFKKHNKPGLGYVYGAGKLVAHAMGKAVAAELGIDLVWGQITNTFGVGESSPRFVNTTLRKIIHGERLSFTSATQNYDFIYIDDVARAFYLLGDAGQPFCEYIIGSSEARPLRGFIEEIVEATSTGVEPQFGDIPYTGVDLPLEIFSTDLLKAHTGFIPSVDFKEGIARTYEWLKAEEKSK